MHDGTDATDQLYKFRKVNETSGFEGVTRTDKENVYHYLKTYLPPLLRKYKFIQLPE